MTFLDNMQEHDLSLLQTLDGREINYSPQNSSPRLVIAMLQEYTELVDGESVEIVSSNPVLSVRTIDIPEINIGDLFTVDGQDYEAQVIKPDNEGITEIILERLWYMHVHKLEMPLLHY